MGPTASDLLALTLFSDGPFHKQNAPVACVSRFCVRTCFALVPKRQVDVATTHNCCGSHYLCCLLNIRSSNIPPEIAQKGHCCPPSRSPLDHHLNSAASP
ncbi:exo-alpha-sialidase [Trypanosoma cruzi]|nr:exo-alpha-sialidase [Trypanosoma cruzi]